MWPEEGQEAFPHVDLKGRMLSSAVSVGDSRH